MFFSFSLYVKTPNDTTITYCSLPCIWNLDEIKSRFRVDSRHPDVTFREEEAHLWSLPSRKMTSEVINRANVFVYKNTRIYKRSKAATSCIRY